ncbi:Zinc finger MYND domain-containing protein 11, partial [Trichinella nelsoni]
LSCNCVTRNLMSYNPVVLSVMVGSYFYFCFNSEAKEMADSHSATSEYAHKLWTILNHLASAKLPATLQNISLNMDKTFRWTADETKARLDDSVSSKLLNCVFDKDIEQHIYQVPIATDETVREHDWYCFECHAAGQLYPCTKCFRVYHSSCISAELRANPAVLLCNACQEIEKEPPCNLETLSPCLSKILQSAEKMANGQFGTLPHPQSGVSDEQYRMLIANHIDLDLIDRKIRNMQYLNPTDFFNDFQLLRHNVFIVFGRDSAMAKLATDLLKEVDTQVKTLQSIMPRRFAARFSEKEKQRKGQFKMFRKPVHSGSDNYLPSEKNVETNGCSCDENYRVAVTDLNNYYRDLFYVELEKMAVEEMYEMEKQFESLRQQKHQSAVQDYKKQLHSIKTLMDNEYNERLRTEIQILLEHNKAEISSAKKQQWCVKCQKEAIYHCCWSTQYCSPECQHSHWQEHRSKCRRKKQET